jgi:arylsulfatase A-like enzyme
MQAAYDECILDLDLEVGQFLEKLKERGHLENTLVLITSDHGEHFGERDLVNHSFSLYMPLLHVPLILLPPSRAPVGEVIHYPVSLLDLPTTVCDLIGLGRQGPFPGRSLARFWEARGALQASRDVPILSQAEPPPYTIPARYPVSKGAMQSLVWRDYHYLKNGDGSEELYHIEDDPQEENNLAGSAAARTVLERLRASLGAGGVA